MAGKRATRRARCRARCRARRRADWRAVLRAGRGCRGRVCGCRRRRRSAARGLGRVSATRERLSAVQCRARHEMLDQELDVRVAEDLGWRRAEKRVRLQEREERDAEDLGRGCAASTCETNRLWNAENFVSQTFSRLQCSVTTGKLRVDWRLSAPPFGDAAFCPTKLLYVRSLAVSPGDCLLGGCADGRGASVSRISASRPCWS